MASCCMTLDQEVLKFGLNRFYHDIENGRRQMFLILETFGWMLYWQNFLILEISEMSTSEMSTMRKLDRKSFS